ncbi:hypothetical protein [Mycobacterium sp. IS-2888]|nr:hypothetical protein [Mycobacterium sp. IS-2888]
MAVLDAVVVVAVLEFGELLHPAKAKPMAIAATPVRYFMIPPIVLG